MRHQQADSSPTQEKGTTDPPPHREEDVFVGRVRELAELRAFVASPEGVLRLVVGKPGIGKSRLLGQLARLLQDDPANMLVIKENLPTTKPEDLAFLLRQVIRRRLETAEAGPSQEKSVGAIKRIAGVVDENRGAFESYLLTSTLQALAAMDAGRVVLILDPPGDVVNDTFKEIFLYLAKTLDTRVKLIVAQRPGDVLASSHELHAIPAVSQLTLGELDRKEVLALLRALLPATLPERLCETMFARLTGWPFALVTAARIGSRLGGQLPEKLEALLQVRQLPDQLQALFQAQLDDARQSGIQDVLFAASLVPGEVDVYDLAAMVGRTEDEIFVLLDGPGRRHFEPSLNGSTPVKLHVLYQEFLTKRMVERHIDPTRFVQRLNTKLADDCRAAYKELDRRSVVERDSIAIAFAIKLSRYQGVLLPGEATADLADVLILRVAAERPGGRSYSLYSLLLLAKAGALHIPRDRLKHTLSTLGRVPFDDSFIHPEYGLLLLASVSQRQRSDIDDRKLYDFCEGRILAIRDKFFPDTRLAELARSVLGALSQDRDVLTLLDAFRLEPQATV